MTATTIDDMPAADAGEQSTDKPPRGPRLTPHKVAQMNYLASRGLHPAAFVASLVLLFLRDKFGIELSADEILAAMAGASAIAAAWTERSLKPALREYRDRLADASSRELAEDIADAVEDASEGSDPTITLPGSTD